VEWAVKRGDKKFLLSGKVFFEIVLVQGLEA
jgi:hypothetical protein